MRFIAYLLLMIGVVIIVAVRIAGVDLTEAWLFLNYLPYWIVAVACILGGCAILSNDK